MKPELRKEANNAIGYYLAFMDELTTDKRYYAEVMIDYIHALEEEVLKLKRKRS
jgi:hypothetical protein|tara:strand:- start:998 stop:1159 length:162 start_codon:yes stop_codon:yes gene_type:complete